MKTHTLKTWPEFFEAVWDGRKNFEFRKNDRDFKVGDRLTLREYDIKTGTYSGREIGCFVTYILEIEEGDPVVVNFVVMNIDVTFRYNGSKDIHLNA